MRHLSVRAPVAIYPDRLTR
ncbi:MAG: hypothetical protein Q9M27_04910 [Mariprofundaceae bacterium]|nr:hypothetical protein [Mariprofundaceae bacterium]